MKKLRIKHSLGFLRLLFALLILSYTLKGQTTTEENRTLPKINIFNSTEFTIQAEVVGYADFKYTIRKNEDEATKKEFTCRPNTYDNFKAAFIKGFEEMEPNYITTVTAFKSADEARKLRIKEDEVNRLYYFFVASDITSGTLSRQPDAGKLFVNKSIGVERNFDEGKLQIRSYVKRNLRQHIQVSKGKVTDITKIWERLIEKQKEEAASIRMMDKESQSLENARAEIELTKETLKKKIAGMEMATKANLDEAIDIESRIISLTKSRSKVIQKDTIPTLKRKLEKLKNEFYKLRKGAHEDSVNAGKKINMYYRKIDSMKSVTSNQASLRSKSKVRRDSIMKGLEMKMDSVKTSVFGNSDLDVEALKFKNGWPFFRRFGIGLVQEPLSRKQRKKYYRSLYKEETGKSVIDKERLIQAEICKSREIILGRDAKFDLYFKRKRKAIEDSISFYKKDQRSKKESVIKAFDSVWYNFQASLKRLSNNESVYKIIKVDFRLTQKLEELLEPRITLEKVNEDIDDFYTDIEVAAYIESENNKLTQKTYDAIYKLVNERATVAQFNIYKRFLKGIDFDRLTSLITQRNYLIETIKGSSKIDDFIRPGEWNAYKRKYLKMGEEQWIISDSLGFPMMQKTIRNLNNDSIEIARLRAFDLQGISKMHEDSLTEIKSKIRKLQKDLNALSLKLPTNTISVSDIQIEFNEGYIENLVVFGDIMDFPDSCDSREVKGSSLTGIKLKFENLSPLGFSRKRDYNQLLKKELHAEKDGFSYSLKIGNLFPTYLEELEVDRRDFSPADQKVRVTFGEQENSKEITYKKLQTQKLFEAKVFSDFVGLADETAPNGIIQTEIDKRFNLSTHRGWESKHANFALFEYVEPSLVISKIEKNNKNLTLSSVDQFEVGQYRPVKFASTIDLRRYEKYSLGFDINIALLDLPNLKSTFRLNFGLRYGSVGITDTLKTVDNNNNIVKVEPLNTFDVNTVRFYPRIIWEILSDERYSFTATFSHDWYFAHTNYFKQVANTQDYSDNQKEQEHVNEYNSVQFFATFKPNGKSESKLFLRFRHFWQQGYFDTTFDQVQVGYSFFITSQLKEPK